MKSKMCVRSLIFEVLLVLKGQNAKPRRKLQPVNAVSGYATIEISDLEALVQFLAINVADCCHLL